jgi:hypothetical protein
LTCEPSASGRDDRVKRGATSNPIYGDSNGIKFNSGVSLTVENCAIRNMTGDGIQMLGSIAANAKVTFTLSNTFVSDNGGNGIYIQPSTTGGPDVRVVLTRVEVYNNSAHGIAVDGSKWYGPGSITSSVLDSVAANNGLSGIITTSGADMTVFRSVSIMNDVGVTGGADIFAGLLVGGSIVTDNRRLGFDGYVMSYGDNYVANSNNGITYLGVIPKK